MIGVILALLPLVVTMTAILVFRVKTHWAGLLGTALTWIVAIGYSKTDPYLLPLAWIYDTSCRSATSSSASPHG